MALQIANQTMRRLWLEVNGLSGGFGAKFDLLRIIKQLGFVQLDTIQNVSRAHHHILWSRHAEYREEMLDQLLATKEDIFEHFTHDASVIPTEFYPMWIRRFSLFKEKFEKSSYYNSDHVREWKDILLDRIREEGPLSTKDFDSKRKKEKEVWSRPPHKQELEYLWYIGVLATSHREKFIKIYDLSECVIPEAYRKKALTDEAQLDWLCQAALKRLGIATAKEIKEFWDAMDLKEARDWVADNRDQLIPVEWQNSQGEWLSSYAVSDIEDRIKNLPADNTDIKIVNPFDPAIRNRVRLLHIFGFDYKLEVFVPEPKRVWGYYVYPLLEGSQFVGRIEAKADRKKKCLNVVNFWPEENVKWTKAREKKLERELTAFAKLAGLEQIRWH